MLGEHAGMHIAQCTHVSMVEIANEVAQVASVRLECVVREAALNADVGQECLTGGLKRGVSHVALNSIGPRTDCGAVKHTSLYAHGRCRRRTSCAHMH